jgi:hypothetical protein
MLKALILVSALISAAIIGGCSSSGSNSNANMNQSVGAGNVTVDANNLPEGLSASPMPPSANTTPGIPDPKDANNVPKGATPTPGIPSPEQMKKPFKPGATPTPGIPDPETLRKQMQRQVNGNLSQTDDAPMMMKKKPVNKPQ